MLAIVTLFDYYPSHSGAYLLADYPACERHIAAIVHRLGITNPSVLAWDIKGEPDRDYETHGETNVKSWLHEMMGYTRQLDPNHLVTIGFYGAARGPLCYDGSKTALIYDPSIAAELSSSVDIVSMHYFVSERCFETDLQSLQAQAGNKPIILEEFGLHTLAHPTINCREDPSNPGCDDPHTETEQAAYYNALLSISEAYDIGGFLFWTLTDFSYIEPGMQQSHYCQGVLRNGLAPSGTCPGSDYSEKPAAYVIRRHYAPATAYVDLLNSWVDTQTAKPPPGWSDNWQVGGLLMRGYNSSEPLWSHTQGRAAVLKWVDEKGTSITGTAMSPELKNIDVDRSPFLVGVVNSYAVRDADNGSNSTLHVGTRVDSQTTRLVTIGPDTTLPYVFNVDLRQAPLNWTGVHKFQVVIELGPVPPNNGYSATYELDWIGVAADFRVHPVSGGVRYYNGGLPVEAVAVHTAGGTSEVVDTDAGGAFAFTGLGGANVASEPEKVGGGGMGISALDAAYVLQFVVNARSLTPNQKLSCDVTGNGTVSALDASRILQHVVGLLDHFQVAQMCVSDWAFIPTPAFVPNQVVAQPAITGTCQKGRISYQPLTAQADGQDFLGILFGDCTGNWHPPSASATSLAVPDPLRAGRLQRGRQGHLRLPVFLNTRDPIVAAHAEVEYDATRLWPIGVRRTGAAGRSLVAFNTDEPGRVRIALASPKPLGVAGSPVVLVLFEGDGHDVHVRSSGYASSE